MITIPLVSGFVNAAVYILFDVALVVILAANLVSIQGSTVLRRLSRGCIVRLRESPLGYLSGPIRADGTKLWVLLSTIQVLVLLVLLFATLGINGRTKLVPERIHRRYITHIPLATHNASLDARSPSLFSKCIISTGDGGLMYYPTAFNTVNNETILDDLRFLGEDGNKVSVDASSLVCQNVTGFTPVLNVVRCCDNILECSNFAILDDVDVNVTSNSMNSSNSVNSSNSIVTFNLSISANSSIGNDYNKAICAIQNTQGQFETYHNDSMCLCALAGVKKENRLKIRIGLLELSEEDLEELAKTGNNGDVSTKFKVYSMEAEIEYNFQKYGLHVFGRALYSLNKDSGPVSARDFLDRFVDMFSASKEVGNTLLYTARFKEHTDIAVYTIIIYSSLTVLLIVIFVISAIFRRRHGPRPEEGYICADVTTYDGLALHLRNLTIPDCKHEYGIRLGLVRDPKMLTYSIMPVSDRDDISRLPKNGLVRCCIEELKDRVETQMSLSDLGSILQRRDEHKTMLSSDDTAG